ncbi:Atu4866 domain-containing protein [Streptomyces sp. NPDC006527]
MDYVGNPAFTATREVRDGILHHEHLTLYRTP